MKKLLVGILVLSLMGLTGLAMAQGRGPGMGYGSGPGGGYGFGPGHGPWASRLNLTPEQTQKLQTLRDGFIKEISPLRNDMISKQYELKAFWAQTNPDEQKILAKQREINNIRAQIQEKAVKHRLEARNVLTPEQQAQIGSGFGSGPGRDRGWGRGYGHGYGHGYGMRGGYGGCGMGPRMGYGPGGMGMGYGPGGMGYGPRSRW